jgi:pimeloyl-ACP methyl ester carboxylesterase
MRSIVYFTALSAFLATTASAKDLQGTWQGYTHLERLDRPYVFNITKDAHDHWAASVIIDEDWGAVWKADSISVDGRKIKFAVPFLGSTYDGQLSEEGNSIEGIWSAGKQPVPLRMVRPTPATRWQETPHKTQLVTVEKNVKVEVLDWGGTRRPIVMLPGADLTAHLFSQFAAKLTPHYHVYGITRRGFGASSVPEVPDPVFSVVAPNTYELKPLPNNPYDADRLGDDIVEVLDALHIERPVLVGHSIAGEELTSVASRYPNRVAGLIYLDAFAEFAFSDGERYDALITAEHPMRMTLPPGQTPHLHPDDAVLLGMHEYRHFPPMPSLAIFALPHEVQGLTGAALAVFQANQQRALARVERIAPLLPTVRIVRLPKADHMVWESNEADVLREMNSFISKLPR